MLSLYRSLLLSTVVSFVTPVILLVGALGLLYTVGYIPGFSEITEAVTGQIWLFLAIFGGGCPLNGIFTIGFVFALVGSLFDLFNFSIHRSRNLLN